MTAPRTSSRKQPVAAPAGPLWDWWLALVLMAVFFTPTLRLPGGIPLRPEDLLIFSTGLIASLRALYTFRIPKTNGPWLYLILLIISILLCTLVAATKHVFPIGPKEYLDVLRPIKFLIILLVVAHTPTQASQRTFIRVMSGSMIALAVIAVYQFTFIKIDSNGIVTKFFLLYSDLEVERARTMLALRPYATFNTPTDLGYVVTIGIFVGLILVPRAKRKWVIGASLLALVISETRTFLFSLPLLFIMDSWLSSRSSKEMLKRLRTAVYLSVAGLILMVAVLRVTSSSGYDIMQATVTAISSGNAQDDASIANRLQNLELTQYTWEHARWFGVVTRSLLGPAADSELLYTFHRYGLVGLTMLLVFYPVGYLCARRARSVNPVMAQFALIMLAITFLYSITQGAIINSRIGVIPFVVLGILSSRDENSRKVTSEFETAVAASA